MRLLKPGFLTIVFASLAFFWHEAFAQVATAPLVPDQRLINPAVLPNRVLRGYSIKLHRDIEKATAPAADNSSLAIETNVDTVGINFGWGSSPYYFEANLLPQSGTRNITSSFKDSMGTVNESDSKRQITLIPVQGLFGIRLGGLGGIGVKALYTNSSFNTDEKYGFSYDYSSQGGSKGTQKSQTTGVRSAGFLTASAGVTLNVFNTGFYVGYSSEFMQLKDDINSQTTTTIDRTTGLATEVKDQNRKSTTTLRKEVMGVGFLTKFSGNNVWRIDVSQEKMPALEVLSSRNGAVTEGKLTRVVTEATWSYFHAGVEITSTSGYYIDPYNLIPYFFGTQDMTAESTVEYGFFGGLKSSKGHSFGLSYSQSNKTKEQNLGGFDPVTLDTSEVTYGLSYMYAF